MDLFDVLSSASHTYEFAQAHICADLDWEKPNEVCSKCFRPMHRRYRSGLTIAWDEGSDVIPDFQFTSLSPTFIVTDRVKIAFERARLKGLEARAVTVHEPKKQRKNREYPIVASPYRGPKLWDIYIDEFVHVVPESSTVERTGVCGKCGTTTYIAEGEPEDFCFVADRRSWHGSDFMLMVEINGNLVTDHVAEVIEAGSYSNVRIRRVGRMSD